jgi:hypothetical protein
MNKARIAIEDADGEIREDRPNRRGEPIKYVELSFSLGRLEQTRLTDLDL